MRESTRSKLVKSIKVLSDSCRALEESLPDDKKTIALLEKVSNHLLDMQEAMSSERHPIIISKTSKELIVARETAKESEPWVTPWGWQVEDGRNRTPFKGHVSFYSDGLHLTWATGTEKRGNWWMATIPPDIVGQWVAYKLKKD